MQASYQPYANLVQTSCKPYANLMPTLCKPCANLMQTSCQPRANLHYIYQLHSSWSKLVIVFHRSSLDLDLVTSSVKNTNLIQTSYQPHTNLVPTLCKSHANLVQTSITYTIYILVGPSWS